VTWTKLSDDFPEQCRDLSSDAFRVHVEALIWVMRRETGGVLTARDLRRALEVDDYGPAVAELMAAGLWVVIPEGYRIVHHMEHQPEPEVIAKRREATADRVRRKRLKDAGIDPDTGEALPPRTPRKQGGKSTETAAADTSNGVTDGVTTCVTTRVTRDGTGRDGQGSYRTEVNNDGERGDGWPDVAPIPGSDDGLTSQQRAQEQCRARVAEAERRRQETR